MTADYKSEHHDLYLTEPQPQHLDTQDDNDDGEYRTKLPADPLEDVEEKP